MNCMGCGGPLRAFSNKLFDGTSSVHTICIAGHGEGKEAMGNFAIRFIRCMVPGQLYEVSERATEPAEKPKTFCVKLKELIARRGLECRDINKRLGLATSTVGAWCMGETEPPKSLQDGILKEIEQMPDGNFGREFP